MVNGLYNLLLYYSDTFTMKTKFKTVQVILTSFGKHLIFPLHLPIKHFFGYILQVILMFDFQLLEEVYNALSVCIDYWQGNFPSPR